jgi:hypothetical protein
LRDAGIVKIRQQVKTNVLTKENSNTLAKLKEQLERISYENSKNGYIVARVRVFGQSDHVTIAGNIQSLTSGAILSMYSKLKQRLM